MPDRNSTILAQLARGTVVKILERKDKWLKVSHNGQTGFISNRQSFVRLQSVEAFGKKIGSRENAGKQLETYKKKAESIGLEIKKEKSKSTDNKNRQGYGDNRYHTKESVLKYIMENPFHHKHNNFL